MPTEKELLKQLSDAKTSELSDLTGRRSLAAKIADAEPAEPVK